MLYRTPEQDFPRAQLSAAYVYIRKDHGGVKKSINSFAQHLIKCLINITGAWSGIFLTFLLIDLVRPSNKSITINFQLLGNLACLEPVKF